MAAEALARLTWPRRYLGALVGLTLLHGVLAAGLPLSGDEAYYWDCSRHLDWAYFDQPPLVIWAMVPFRVLLGETALAVRMPAILASLLIGLFLLPLARRLGGGAREATLAYLLLHVMPLFFLGSFYASTDIAMAAAWTGATWAAVALAQGERRAWWGFGVAVGLGFLAKFPVVLVALALVPVLREPAPRRQLGTPTPWLAAGLSLLLTAPVWIWGARHGWANVWFQIAGRHDEGGLTLAYLAEFLAANLLLATPFLALAMLVAWGRGWRRRDPAWNALLSSAAAPLVVFGLISLGTGVGAHWGGPGLLLATLPLAFVRFRGRRLLIGLGAAFCALLVGAALLIVTFPERLLDLRWSYRGKPERITTDKLDEVIGWRELAARVAVRRQPGELVASDSYTTVHLLAFLTRGSLPTRLADLAGGQHGFASLYWYEPSELAGRDVLFVTDKDRVVPALDALFVEVTELEPIAIVRHGEVARTARILRCRDLRDPVPAFTRLEP